MSLPEPEPITLSLPRDLWDKVNRKAIDEGVKPEGAIIRALRESFGIPERSSMAVPYKLPKQTRKP